MKYPITIKREVKPNVIQFTLNDKRWYIVETDNGDKLYYPAVTWILDAYPKGIGFRKWLAALPDFEYGQQILAAAGDRGTKVHWGVERLLKNETIEYLHIPDGYYDHFSPEEWGCLMSFVSWYRIFRPTVINVEETIISHKYGFGGTADLIAICDEGLLTTWNARSKKEPVPNGNQVKCFFDWKTGLNIYESYKLQVYAYTAEMQDVDYVGIIRLGSKHKTGFEFWLSKVNDDERPDYFGAFLHTFEIWKHEHNNPKPTLLEAPDSLSLVSEITESEIQEADNAQERHDTKSSDGFPW